MTTHRPLRLLDLGDELVGMVFAAPQSTPEGASPGASHAHLAALRLTCKRSKAIVDSTVRGVVYVGPQKADNLHAAPGLLQEQPISLAGPEEPNTARLFAAPWLLQRISLTNFGLSLPARAAPAWQPTLVSLRLVGCNMRPKDLQTLCSLALPALEELALADNSSLAGAGGRLAEVAEVDWPRLRELDLRRTGVTSAEVLTRARWPLLEVLRLGRNELATPEQLCGGQWPLLRLLDLRLWWGREAFPAEALEALRSRWPPPAEVPVSRGRRLLRCRPLRDLLDPF